MAKPAHAVTLHLKRRPIRDQYNLPSTPLHKLLDEGDKNKLWDFFRNLRELPQYVHDIEWLRQLCALPVAQGGTTPKDWAAWAKLLLRIDNLNDQVEGTFTIPLSFGKLIKDRLSDPNFKLPGAMSPQWAGFYVDLCTALDYQPITDNDLWNDKEWEFEEATEVDIKELEQ